MSHLSKKIIGGLLCLLAGSQLPAQNKPAGALPDHCGSSRAMKTLYQQHPAAQKTAARLEAFTKQFATRLQQPKTAQDAVPNTYVIPVVFHVNDAANPYKVTLEQVRSAIDILNQDYNLLNGDRTLLDPRFAGLAANLRITFRLAEIDPQGNPTSGITYHLNDFDGRSPDGYGTDVKSVSYWPGEKYLNIWIVSEVEEKGVYNNSGWSFLPDDWVANNHLDGIVYNWRYLGAPGVGSSQNGEPNMKRVLTHEIGHFLNLSHTFEGGCVAPGDYVDDTPPTQSNYGNCNVNANWCGSIANVENYMDYSACARMFTTGQKNRMWAALNSHVAQRSNLWSAANLAATLLPDNSKRIVPGFSVFMEDEINNGSITVTDTLRAFGGARFAVSNGNLIAGTHYTIQNIPAGLTAAIRILNDTTAAFTLSGQALQHDTINNTDNLKLTFLNPAIQGGTSNLLASVFTLGVRFLKPYKIIYNNIPDIVINPSNIWKYFTLDGLNVEYGAWLNNGKLRFETYEKAAVCEGTSRNISPLAAGTIIGASSNFVNGGAHPNQHDIYSSTYTQWAGKTAFIGIKFDLNGKPRYGWMRVTVAADGSGYTLKDYAWSEAPNGNIIAGDPGTPTLSWSRTGFRENQLNDGQLTDTAEVSPLGTTFAISSGNLVPNTHYTVSNLPAGISLQLKAVNNTTVSVAFSGKASSHTAANNTTATIHLLPALFTGGQTAVNATQPLSIRFRNPYQIEYVDVNDTLHTANATNTWYKFWINNLEDAPFGVWYNGGQLQFETYTQPMVCASDKNISLLAPNTMISDTSHLVAGGAYPNEHALYTSSYTTWKGKTGYAGFSFFTEGDRLYGWFRFKVNDNGTGYTLMDYAYNSKPGDSIRAGQTSTPTDTAVTPQEYCPASTALNYNSITRVRLGNLDNNSLWDGYRNFTNLSANLTTGQSYQLTINLGIEYWPDISVAAWIDWNGDKVLNDTTEKIYVKRGTGPFTQTITVPANAKTGNTLLRVRMGYGSNVKPCGVDNYQGEVEDYTVKISSSSSSTLTLLPHETTGQTGLTATSPFTNQIYLQYAAVANGPVLIRLYDLRGSLIKQQPQTVQKGANVLSLQHLSDLLPGLYIIDVQQGNKHVTTKVIK
ncbi:zinc-dependent metalloprotease [Chitinophaga nivalis]|uniref:Zinc-dependent metalloprotease n=1 Tax=Chitinophaga nivalis TaxID=2991709 RepID=A0ABT3IML3_9BACT|nr:zinc-dependent metalloprotease [Chitinophaga nivalis]MCW3465098.1 zinc-dependent metalloprotease [Chitinophaga nivalis]MCW3485210.1 zinc-dependent metalloprotease [Chitinophaga nivalis]